MSFSLDLVELQIRIAAGEKIPFSQEEISRHGHAIEVRINAENPAQGRFVPSPGPITKFLKPDGFGTRLDSGYESGDNISQFYDNLIAKLIVWAPDRPKAIARMLRALSETEIEGVHTTIPALEAILSHPDFKEGKHSTKWVEEKAGLENLEVKPLSESEPTADTKVERQIDAEVNGRRYQVRLWLNQQDIAGTPSLALSPNGIRKPDRKSVV